jgi:transposase
MYVENNNINDLRQPPLSPDLNPIEHLWDELGRSVRQRPVQPTNLRELGIALVEEWNRIPQNRLAQLVESMPRRLVDVIAARGSHTRY